MAGQFVLLASPFMLQREDRPMRLLLLLILIGGLQNSRLSAQQAHPDPADSITDDFAPASTNQPGKEYPQVNSQRRVKFRIVAPEAKSVGVTFRDSTDFVKGEDGAWIGNTRPLDEGFHYYAIRIDGAEVPDPNSKYFFGASRWGECR